MVVLKGRVRGSPSVLVLPADPDHPAGSKGLVNVLRPEDARKHRTLPVPLLLLGFPGQNLVPSVRTRLTFVPHDQVHLRLKVCELRTTAVASGASLIREKVPSRTSVANVPLS